MNFTVDQNSLQIFIRWSYDGHHSWVVTKERTYLTPSIVQEAEVLLCPVPKPTTAELSFAQISRWQTASDLCHLLNLVFVRAEDFTNVTIKVEQDAITTAHHNITSGRVDSRHTVTIYIP